MIRVIDCFTLEHDQRLVLLAAAILLVGTASTVLVANRAGHGRRGLWLALVGACAGAAVWSTHFIAMLAYRPGVPMTFDGSGTLFSLLVGTVVMTGGFALAAGRSATGATDASAPSVSVLLGGVLVGGGVVLLHYVGLGALRLPGRLGYDADLVTASVLFALVFGAAALDALYRRRRLLQAAGLFVAMVLTLHFVSMGAVHIELGWHPELPDQSGLSRGAIAVAVAVASLLLLLVGVTAAALDRRVSRRLGLAAARFQALADGAFEGLVVHRDGRITEANGAAREMFATAEGAVPETIDDWFGRTLALELRRGVEADPTEGTTELELRRADGSRFPAEVRRRRISLDDRDGGELLAIRDLSARRRTEARIRHLALHDPLTDLANRRHFMDRAREALQRGDGAGVAVLILDLDSFKQINDLHGHGVGDELMREVARRLRDAMPGQDLPARLGGDEFAVLQQHAPQPGAGLSLAARLVEALKRPVRIDHLELHVTASVGVACAPEHGDSVETLLRNADTAMYAAKADGKADCRMYRPEMDTQMQARRRFEGRLRAAVSEQRLSVHYQPVVDCGTREVLGFEALLRWHEPDLGWVAPADCIPVAEATGLIVPIGDFVLQRACADAASWAAPLRVAVNLSPVQFRRPGLADAVRRALNDSGLPGSRLELEITESMLIENREDTLRVLTELRGLGVRIAMDDFGTGYSSLSYLQSFPFDKIKIDRVFVAGLDSSVQAASIVKAVKALGESLNMRVVAEGVESDSQALRLGELHCDELQGYLIGRPMPLDQVAAFLARGAEGAAQRDRAPVSPSPESVTAEGNGSAEGGSATGSGRFEHPQGR